MNTSSAIAAILACGDLTVLDGMHRLSAAKAVRLRQPTPEERKPPLAGRNDPCPCKSGKKYKRCCRG
jgi:uncharacterized protein YecA (UPF0149 family)